MPWNVSNIPDLSGRVAVVTGALPQLRAATDPRARGGELYAPRFVTNGPPVRRPVGRRIGLDRAIDTLWTVSARETGTVLDLDAARAGGA